MIATTVSALLIAHGMPGQNRQTIGSAQRLSPAKRLELINAAAKRMGITKQLRIVGSSKVLTTRNGHTDENGHLVFGPRTTIVDFAQNTAKFPPDAGTVDDFGFRIMFQSKAPSAYYAVDVELTADGGGAGGVIMSARSNRLTSGGNAITEYSTELPNSSGGHFVFVLQAFETSLYRLDVWSNVPWTFKSAEINRLQ